MVQRKSPEEYKSCEGSYDSPQYSTISEYELGIQSLGIKRWITAKLKQLLGKKPEVFEQKFTTEGLMRGLGPTEPFTIEDPWDISAKSKNKESDIEKTEK